MKSLTFIVLSGWCFPAFCPQPSAYFSHSGGLDDLIGSDASFSDYSVMMTFKPDPFSELETPWFISFVDITTWVFFRKTQCYLSPFPESVSGFLPPSSARYYSFLFGCPSRKAEIILDSPLVYHSHKLLVAACGI